MADGIKSSIVGAVAGGAAAGVDSVNALDGAVLLVAGSGIDITDDGSHTITIAATGGGSGVTAGANVGTGAQVFKQLATTTLQFRTLVQGANITLTQGANDITIDCDLNPAVESVGTIDSQTPSANGAVIAVPDIFLQSASASVPGIVNLTTQTFAGNKTFSGTIAASNLSGTNSGNVTIGTANGLSILAQVLSLALASTSVTGALSSTDWNTFNGKQAAGNYITALTGDVTASGPGSAAATVVSVGGENASAIAATVATVGNATPLSAPNTIVERDSNGDFTAGVITAALAGDVTGNVTGNLTGNVTGNVSGTAASVTGVVTEAHGGTNQSTYATGDLLYASNTNTLAKRAIGSTGNILTVVAGIPAWAAAPSGGLPNVSSINTTTTMAANTYYFADSFTIGAFTATFPSASAGVTRIIVKKITSDFNPITLARAGSDNIVSNSGPVTSTTLDTMGESCEFISDGVSLWYLVERVIPSFWTTYTPIFTGGGTKGTVVRDVARWKRIGDSIQGRYDYAQSTLAGSTGSTISMSLPSALTFDSGKLPIVTSQEIHLGTLSAFSGSTSIFYRGAVILSSSSAVVFAALVTAAGGQEALFGNAPFGFGNAATLQLSAKFTGPITGWNA